MDGTRSDPGPTNEFINFFLVCFFFFGGGGSCGLHASKQFRSVRGR
jgi:hypothetical protein